MNFTGRFGKLFSLMDQLGSIAMLNLMFLACCIPIITIPSAVTALYSCTLSMARGEGCDARRFFGSMKRDIKAALGVGLVLGGLAAAVALNLYLSVQMELPGPMMYAQYAVLLLLVMTASYAFPMAARFGFSLPQYLKFSLLLSIQNLPKTAVMVVLNLLPVILLLLDGWLFLRLAILWLIFGFALTAYVNARLLHVIFKPYTGEIDREGEEE